MYRTVTLSLVTPMLAAATASASNLTMLWFDKPAARWEEALPVGNGRLGAMVLGGTAEERLQLNDSTLWGGKPHDYANPEAGPRLAELRRLIFEGNISKAEQLGGSMLGTPASPAAQPSANLARPGVSAGCCKARSDTAGRL